MPAHITLCRVQTTSGHWATLHRAGLRLGGSLSGGAGKPQPANRVAVLAKRLSLLSPSEDTAHSGALVLEPYPHTHRPACVEYAAILGHWCLGNRNGSIRHAAFGDVCSPTMTNSVHPGVFSAQCPAVLRSKPDRCDTWALFCPDRA